MGISCSNSVTLQKADNQDSSPSPSSNGSITTNTASKTIQSPSVWNPFNITRMEAENLLKTSDPGSFIFSHDLTSELFLSLSVGKYVCHHSVVTRDNSYYVGAKQFDTVGDVISYFRDHPLGGTTLKEEFKRPPPITSTIQVKQHPDVLIQSSATASTSDVSSSESEGKKTTITHVQLANQMQERSPALRRNQNQRVPVERIEEECVENGNTEDIVEKNNKANKISTTLHLPQNKVAPLPRKPLLRSGAVERQESTSSGGDREVPSSISLMPLLSQQDCTIQSSSFS